MTAATDSGLFLASIADRINCAAGEHAWRGPLLEYEDFGYLRQFRVCAPCGGILHYVWSVQAEAWERWSGKRGAHPPYDMRLPALEKMVAEYEREANSADLPPMTNRDLLLTQAAERRRQLDHGKRHELPLADDTRLPAGWCEDMKSRLR